MAGRFYYGVCASAADTIDKRVWITDVDIVQDGFVFEKGDLLVVYFSQRNEATDPTIIIYDYDPSLDVSNSNDNGKYIKTYSIISDVEVMWGDGETVIFAYTETNENIGYWNLIEGVKASKDIYGVTKLADLGDSTFADWLNTVILPDDDETVVTPTMLKEFYRMICAVEDEDEEEEIDWSSSWEPSIEGDQEELGTLHLFGNQIGLSITYPLTNKIEEVVGTIPTHTGQLINNGNGPGVQSNDPFLTKYIPGSLWFTDGNGLHLTGNEASDPPYITLNHSNTHKIILKGVEGIVLDSATQVNGAFNAGTTSINGALTASGNIVASGNSAVKGKTLYEDNVSLENKYSPQFIVLRYQSPLLTYPAAGEDSHNPTSISSQITRNGGHLYITQTEYNSMLSNAGKTSSEWEPVGLVGFNIDGSSTNNSTNAAPFCHLWEYHILPSNNASHPNCVEYSIRNTRNAPVSIYIQIYILFRKKFS